MYKTNSKNVDPNKTDKMSVNDQESTNQASISDLPYEVLGKIYEFLPNQDKKQFAQVNSDFYQVKTINWKIPDSQTKETLIDDLRERYEFLRSHYKNFAIRIILDCGEFPFNDQTLEEVSNLLGGDLCGITLNDQNAFFEGGVTEEGIAGLSENCPNLEQIELGLCDAVIIDGISALTDLVNGSPKFSTIQVNINWGIELDELEEKLIDDLRESYNFLREHYDSEIKIMLEAGPRSLNDQILGEISSIFGEDLYGIKLDGQDLYGEGGITDDGIIKLSNNCPNLAHFELERSDNVTADGIIALAKSCPQLSSIDLSECRNLSDGAKPWHHIVKSYQRLYCRKILSLVRRLQT